MDSTFIAQMATYDNAPQVYNTMDNDTVLEIHNDTVIDFDKRQLSSGTIILRGTAMAHLVVKNITLKSFSDDKINEKNVFAIQVQGCFASILFKNITSCGSRGLKIDTTNKTNVVCKNCNLAIMTIQPNAGQILYIKKCTIAASNLCLHGLIKMKHCTMTNCTMQALVFDIVDCHFRINTISNICMCIHFKHDIDAEPAGLEFKITRTRFDGEVNMLGETYEYLQKIHRGTCNISECHFQGKCFLLRWGKKVIIQKSTICDSDIVANIWTVPKSTTRFVHCNFKNVRLQLHAGITFFDYCAFKQPDSLSLLASGSHVYFSHCLFHTPSDVSLPYSVAHTHLDITCRLTEMSNMAHIIGDPTPVHIEVTNCAMLCNTICSTRIFCTDVNVPTFVRMLNNVGGNGYIAHVGPDYINNDIHQLLFDGNTTHAQKIHLALLIDGCNHNSKQARVFTRSNVNIDVKKRIVAW